MTPDVKLHSMKPEHIQASPLDHMIRVFWESSVLVGEDNKPVEGVDLSSAEKGKLIRRFERTGDSFSWTGSSVNVQGADVPTKMFYTLTDSGYHQRRDDDHYSKIHDLELFHATGRNYGSWFKPENG